MDPFDAALELRADVFPDKPLRLMVDVDQHGRDQRHQKRARIEKDLPQERRPWHAAILLLLARLVISHRGTEPETRSFLCASVPLCLCGHPYQSNGELRQITIRRETKFLFAGGS